MGRIGQAIKLARKIKKVHKQMSGGQASASFEWIIPPSALALAIQRYGDQVVEAVQEIARYVAVQAESDMKLNAKWTDRTGNARAGLFAFSQMAAGDVVEIFLSHGTAVNYGRWLELGHGMRYAIIVPTLQKIVPELEEKLKTIFR